MEQFLIDNNVISNYFAERFSRNGMDFVGNIIDDVPVISVITEIEALSWINPDKNKEHIIKDFIHDCTIITLSPAIVTKCIAIRRNRKIKTPDAIIAATAITNNLTLVTSDKDYNGIADLNIIDPATL